MIIKKLQDVPFAAASGYEGVKKQVLIGPDDGSNEIVMRYFRLAPGGSTPHHAARLAAPGEGRGGQGRGGRR